MNQPAIQDYYSETRSHCWGCGRLNQHGFHIKSYPQGDEVVCQFLPEDYHTAYPGYLNGGIIATMIDCHSLGTAFYHASQHGGEALTADSPLHFVTASLHVDYLKPTPLIGQPVELRARVVESAGRKVRVACSLYADGIETARGDVLAVRLKEDLP